MAEPEERDGYDERRLDEKRLIYARFMPTESGRLHNATIETLAIALYRDWARPDAHGNPPARWCETSHEMRQRFRRMAEGQEELP